MGWLSAITAGIGLASNLFGRDDAQQNFSSAQAFNREEAAAQRAFQERMFRTRHQMEVEDLKAAGLNPILSAGGQPPIPQGASAQAVQPDFGGADRRTRRLEMFLTTAKVASEVLLNKSLAGKADADAYAALRHSGGNIGVPGFFNVPLGAGSSAKRSEEMRRKQEELERKFSKMRKGFNPFRRS